MMEAHVDVAHASSRDADMEVGYACTADARASAAASMYVCVGSSGKLLEDYYCTKYGYCRFVSKHAARLHEREELPFSLGARRLRLNVLARWQSTGATGRSACASSTLGRARYHFDVSGSSMQTCAFASLRVGTALSVSATLRIPTARDDRPKATRNVRLKAAPRGAPDVDGDVRARGAWAL